MRTVENVSNADTGHVVYVNLKGRNLEKFELPSWGAATRKIAELEEIYDEKNYVITYRDERVFMHPANTNLED
jgi:hypothetical protein